MMARSAEIVGVGSCLPEKRLTNADLEKMVNTSDEWILTRTGISERRIVAQGEATSDLAVRACESAISDAGIEPGDIDLLVVATSTPDMLLPSTACLVQAHLGLTCPAFDMNAACTGFIYGLHTASSAIEAGRADVVLLVGADTLTRVVDFKDRRTCVLFGDGAGAAVLRASENPGVRSIVLGADGKGNSMLKIPAGGSAMPASPETVQTRLHFIQMNGNEVFKFAVRAIPRATRAALAASEIDVSELAWLVPHQANQRILDTIADRLHVPHERVFSNLATTGNTSAASIPLAIDDLYTSGRLAPGNLLALVGFGAGVTWGAAIVEWTKATPGKEA